MTPIPKVTLPTTTSALMIRLQRPTVLLLGDSITEFGYGQSTNSNDIGWVSLLSAAYTRRCDILNRGYSGYNTQHAMDIVLPRIFGDSNSSNHPATDNNDDHEEDGQRQQQLVTSTARNKTNLLFCTVFFGANDAVVLGEPQHVPIDKYAENLHGIIQTLRQHTTTTTVSSSSSSSSDNDNNNVPVLFITPPPIDEVAWCQFRQITVSDRTNDRARDYGNKVKEVAAMYPQCAVVDSWTLLQGHSTNSNDRSQYLCDGLHLNEAGNRKLYHGIMDVLQANFPHLLPMDDNDGDGRYGTTGIPKEEKLWRELC